MNPYELLPFVQNEILFVSTELNVATNIPNILVFCVLPEDDLAG